MNELESAINRMSNVAFENEYASDMQLIMKAAKRTNEVEAAFESVRGWAHRLEQKIVAILDACEEAAKELPAGSFPDNLIAMSNNMDLQILTNATGYKILSKSDNSDQPLKIKIKDNVLCISIGVNTLAFALEHIPKAFSEPAYKSTNNAAFAVDVQSELTREEEDGANPVHLLLDEAINKAIENGSAFVEEIPNENSK